jgi:putative flippase GtrA
MPARLTTPDVFEFRQFLRFAVVGIAQNGTNIGVFAFGVAIGIPYVLAAVVAAVIALTVSFLLNRHWAFPDATDQPAARALRFVAVWLFFLALVLPALVLLVDVAHLPKVGAQMIVILVGAPLSYILQRRWTFGASTSLSQLRSVEFEIRQTAPPARLQTPAPRERATSSAISLAIASHERLVTLALAIGAGALVFAPRIKTGGLLVDDWALYSEVRFPRAAGFTSSFAALSNSAGSRLGAIPYWLASFSLFGNHTKLYALTAAALAVMLAVAIYLLMRELRFGIAAAITIMLLTLASPSVEAARFWFTPSGGQIALILFFLGLTLALRAFMAAPSKRKLMHAGSWALYLASAVYAEVALPLITAAVLVYVTRAPLRRSLMRWACDLAIVVVGYLAASWFVSEHKGFVRLPASMWLEHARLMADQALSICTSMLVPFYAHRTQILIALGGLAIAVVVIWRMRGTSAEVRGELRRWTYALIVCVISIAGIYATYVPAMLYYEPLGPGLATHINLPIVASLAVGVFSVVMLARVVTTRLLVRVSPRLMPLPLVLAAAWLGVITIDGVRHVRSDAHVWSVAAARDYHVLHVVSSTLAHPVPNSTVYTFGEAGTAAPGLPVFFSSFELTNAIKIAYGRGDVSAYPVVVDDDIARCEPHGVIVVSGSTPLNAPSPYGRSYFFDVPSQRYELINSAANCAAAMTHFHPGPYTTGNLKWSYH